jgi:acetyl esterase/lipase
MLWFRHNYLHNQEDWTKWDPSPFLAPDDLASKIPKAWIGVTELDILRDEGIQYGAKLSKVGIEVEIKELRILSWRWTVGLSFCIWDNS